MTSAFAPRGGVWHCDDVPLPVLAAAYGTPLYVYSATALERALVAYQQGFGARAHLICYSVKAASNLAIISTLVAAGAGCDIVSGGELERALLAGCPPGKIVFSGMGKRRDELEAAIAADIACINVESAAELELVDAVARAAGKPAKVALRVNPDVDARTHRYIATGLRTSKFGVPIADALALYARARAMPGVQIRGVACHIGSQLLDLAPLADALGRLVPLVRALADAGDPLTHVDVGGGLGIAYADTAATPPSRQDYARVVTTALAPVDDLGLTIFCEPGRSIVGEAGALVTRVLHDKPGGDGNTFTVVDAAMTELIRPALYDAVHPVVPVRHDPAAPMRTVDVVGPVCESGDVLARARQLPVVSPGELVAILGAGAYGMAMASTYNTRPRAAEVLVRGATHTLVRRRETVADLVRGERLPDGRLA